MLKRSPILFLLLLSMLACSLPSSFGPTPTPDYAFHATETDEILAQIRGQDLAKIVSADFYARYDCQVSFFRDPDSGGSREQCSYTPYYDFRLDAASPANKLRFDKFWAATGETFSIELPHAELFTDGEIFTRSAYGLDGEYNYEIKPQGTQTLTVAGEDIETLVAFGETSYPLSEGRVAVSFTVFHFDQVTGLTLRTETSITMVNCNNCAPDIMDGRPFLIHVFELTDTNLDIGN